MNKRFIALLKEKFLAGLNEKTGWGRNEVRLLFERCLGEAALECLDEETAQKEGQS